MQLVELSPSFQQGKILNLAKYLITALEQDYLAPVSSQVFLSPQKKLEPASVIPQDTKKSTNETRAMKKAYSIYLTSLYNAALNSLSEDEKSDLYEQFAIHIKSKGSDFLQDLFHKKRFQSKFVEMEFRQFIQIEFPHLLPTVADYEEFTQKLWSAE
jgi:hypothetical protein